jgi:hypothetical protein
MTFEFTSATLKGTRELLTDEVSGSNTNSEASCLVLKCGTHRSDSLIWAS